MSKAYTNWGVESRVDKETTFVVIRKVSPLKVSLAGDPHFLKK